MYSRKFAVAAVSAIVLAASAGIASAQVDQGALVGAVRDSTGAVVPNANITATNTGTNVVYPTISNAAGEYRISNLPVGVYDIKAVVPGFAPNLVTGLAITANSVQTKDFALGTAGQSTTVEVQSQASVSIDTTTAQIAETFSQQEVQDLPTATVGLGALNLALQAPGAVSSGGVGAGVGPSVSGQRPRNNNFLIDGIDNNSKSTTGPELIIPNESVQQFVALENVYSAQYGHSTGGQFNQIIKTGSNSVHGGIYEYFQNRNLNAVTSFQGIANASNKVSGHFNPRFDFNRYGGTLGGPIIKDKVFAFANYERQTTGQLSTPNTICAPTAAGMAQLSALNFANKTNLQIFQQYYPTAANPSSGANDPACASTTIPVTPTGGTQSNIQVGDYTVQPPNFTNYDFLTTSGDWTIGPKDTLRIRYAYNRRDSTDTTATLPIFYTGAPARFHLALVNYSHTFTANLLNDIRFGYNRVFTQTPVGPQSFPGLNSFPNLVFVDLSGSGVQLGPDGNAPQETIQDLYSVVENLQYVKGKHTINVGVEGRKYISPEIFTQRIRGDYEYNHLSEYLNDITPTSLGQRNATSTGQAPTFYGDQSSIYLYGNDDWRVTPKLTFNLGLRWEFTTVPVTSRLQSLEGPASTAGLLTFGAPQPQYTNFQPRIGIVYAPNENTSIRAGFGTGYDVNFDNLGLNSAPLAISTTENVVLTAGTPGFLAGGGLPSQISNIIFTDPAQEKTAIGSYIQNQVLPYSEQYTLGIQHVFAQAYTAEIRYVGTRGIHLDTQVQLNSSSPVNAANQLPTNLNGGGVQPNGNVTLASLETSTGSYAYTNVNGAAATATCPYYRTAVYCAAGYTSAITGYFPLGASNYNGLQTQLTRRFQNGLLLNFAYTYSRAFDDSTADVASTYLNPRRAQSFQNYRAEYSRSDLDHPNRLSMVAIYDVPFFKNSGFLLKNLLGNLELAPVYTYQSPQYSEPQSAIDSNLNGDSAADRTFINPTGVVGTAATVVPIVNASIACAAGTAFGGVVNNTSNLAPNCTANTIGYTAGIITGATPTARAFFTPTPNRQYVQGGLGTLPTASRNTQPINPIDNLDLTAVKRFSYHDRYKLEIQVQAFNVLNHSQFLPGSLNTVNSVGSFTSGASNYSKVNAGGLFNNSHADFNNNARSLQLAGKFSF